MSRKAIATKIQSLQPPLTPSPELRRLDIFVGKWHTEGLSYGSGQSKENPYDSAVRWSSEETYEWLTGGFFLVHHCNGQIGDAPINAMETIGYDAASQTYPSQFFDNYGGIHLGHWSVRDGVWSCTATEYRTTYTFSNDCNILAVHWEWFDGEDWLVWGDLKATKVE